MKAKAALIAFLAFSLLASGIRLLSAGENESWKVEWERTVGAAKREGKVTVYHTPGSPGLIIEGGVFQKRFPEIKVLTLPTDQVVPRILAERRAGVYLADVVIGSATGHHQLYSAKALDPIRDALILPEVTDESKWWGGRHGYSDPEKRYGLSYMGIPQGGLMYYNTTWVDHKEFRSVREFLDPKWRGKISARDVRAGGGQGPAALRFFYYHPKLGAEFIRRLFGEMDITLFRDRRQAIDWLATGKFPICFFCGSTDVGRARRQGLPVAAFGMMKEGGGLTSSSGNIGLVNRAPHSNAAKVFINWLLSREGQLTVQTENAKAMSSSNSLRMDIPKDMVPPEERLVEGVEYINVDTPERIDMGPILKILEETLVQAEQRRKK